MVATTVGTPDGGGTVGTTRVGPTVAVATGAEMAVVGVRVAVAAAPPTTATEVVTELEPAVARTVTLPKPDAVMSAVAQPSGPAARVVDWLPANDAPVTP
jgi:hypothetical protein